MSNHTQWKLALAAEIEKLQKENDRMRQIGNTPGFYKAYFSLLKDCKTDVEAFNLLNDEYFELFGMYRYSDWDAFRNSMKYHNKKSS